MWATAYLDKKLPVASKEEQEKEVALFTTWCKRRYLSSGIQGNNMTVEAIGYTDMILEQLGFNSHHAGGVKEMFGPWQAKNFAGLKGEYIRKYRSDDIKA